MNTALPMRSIASTALALTWALIGVVGVHGTAHAADVYCRTVNKSLQCSDVPMEGAVLVRRSGQSRSPGDGAQATSSTAAVSSPGFSPPVSAAAARLQEEATARAVQQDVAKKQNEQCKQATERYEKSVEARRLYKTGPNGERTYLTEAELAVARVEARNTRDAACGSAPR